LNIERIPFDHTDGNVQGFARDRRIAINPLAQLPTKTLFHELGHVILGHTTEAEFADADTTPRSLREVEAESGALLCSEYLGLEGTEFCRGYIQNWLRRGNGFDAEAIPEKSAQKIFRAAAQIIRAGRQKHSPPRPHKPPARQAQNSRTPRQNHPREKNPRQPGARHSAGAFFWSGTN